MTRSCPFWRQTKSRPSGAKAMAVGAPPRLLPNWDSTKPLGSVAAGSVDQLSPGSRAKPKQMALRKIFGDKLSDISDLFPVRFPWLIPAILPDKISDLTARTDFSNR